MTAPPVFHVRIAAGSLWTVPAAVVQPQGPGYPAAGVEGEAVARHRGNRRAAVGVGDRHRENAVWYEARKNLGGRAGPRASSKNQQLTGLVSRAAARCRAPGCGPGTRVHRDAQLAAAENSPGREGPRAACDAPGGAAAGVGRIGGQRVTCRSRLGEDREFGGSLRGRRGMSAVRDARRNPGPGNRGSRLGTRDGQSHDRGRQGQAARWGEDLNSPGGQAMHRRIPSSLSPGIQVCLRVKGSYVRRDDLLVVEQRARSNCQGLRIKISRRPGQCPFPTVCVPRIASTALTGRVARLTLRP